MDPDGVALAFTVLVGAGLVGIASACALALAGRPAVLDELSRNALALAAIVAVGATAGSLYFSEEAGFTPCELCWFQRIAMYPLAPLLLVAALRTDLGVRVYGGVLVAAGAAVSAYHYQLQAFPGQGSTCSADAPCSFRWVEVFGFVSIPLLALGAFLIIAGLLAVAGREVGDPQAWPASPHQTPEIP